MRNVVAVHLLFVSLQLFMFKYLFAKEGFQNLASTVFRGSHWKGVAQITACQKCFVL